MLGQPRPQQDDENLTGKSVVAVTPGHSRYRRQSPTTAPERRFRAFADGFSSVSWRTQKIPLCPGLLPPWPAQAFVEARRGNRREGPELFSGLGDGDVDVAFADGR